VAARDRAERRLAKRLARRDPDALRELYDLHGRATFNFLVRVLGDRAAAEDVQQQVFFEAWERGERYDPERAGLLTWLLTVARSRAIDHLRRRFYLDQSQTEIAAATGVPLGTVKTRMSSGLRRLRSALEEQA
jgi:RNA polymerase sigma-70 factor (ECF subfamily)